MTGDNDDRAVQRGHEAMGPNETELDCDWCAFDPASAGQPARFGVTVQDCCNDQSTDYLLCEDHWTLLRDQQLPGECPRCGATATDLAQIVTTVIPFGDVDDSVLQPSGRPADTTTLAELQILPNAIRRPIPTTDPTHSADTPASTIERGTIEDAPPAQWVQDLAVTDVDPYDYEVMVVREWRRRREEEIAAEDSARYAAPLQQLRTQLDVTDDPTTVHQLAAQIHAIDHNRTAAAYQAKQAWKNDQHDYSLWRQTPDGRYFVEWMQRAFTVATWIRDRDDEWTSLWRSMLDSIPDDEVQAHTTGIWVPRTRRRKIAPYLLSSGVVTCVLGVVAGLVLPLLFLVAVLGGIAAACGLIMMRDDGWSAANAAAADKARRRRIERFTFDPLDEPDRPAPSWTTYPNHLRYAAELEAWALVGLEDHPPAEQLPEPHYLPLASRKVVPAEMQHLLLRR